MKLRGGVGCAAIAALLSFGCSAESRHTVLTVFFDGVPPLEVPPPEGLAETADGPVERVSRVGFGGHGPYAARMCGACHQSAATNKLVVPVEELCFRCHDIRMDKKYIHGPLASGGCKACHDPHSSRYRYLLVSESDDFCFHCHEEQVVAAIPAHGGSDQSCTACHDAHMSNQKYLLR